MADISKLVLEVDSSGVVKATNNLDKFSKSSQTSEKSIGKSIKTFGKFAGVIGAVTVALKTAIKFAKESLSAFASFETVKTNLQIVTGSAKEAEKQFKSLKKLAASTPFEIEGLTNASIALQQVGVKASEVEKTIRMLGDASGGNNELFNRISQNYAQILSVGKASAMDIKQFAQMGLPVYQLMKDMGIQGTVTADQVTEMFKRMTSEGGTFFNGMELQSNTLNGKISTLKDTWKGFLSTFAETSGLADATKKVMDDLTERIQHLNDEMERTKEGSKLAEGYREGTVEGQYAYLNSVIQQQESILKANNITLAMIESSKDLQGDFGYLSQEIEILKNAKEEIKLLEEQFKKQEKLKKIEEERLKIQEQLMDKAMQDAQTHSELMVGINEEYARLNSNEQTQLEEKIKFYQELLGKTKHVHQEISRGEGFSPIVSDYDTAMFSAEEQAKIQSVINGLVAELEELKKSLEKSTWKDVFKKITGVDVSQFKGKEGLKGATLYGQNIDKEIEQQNELNKLLGKNNTIDILTAQRDKVESDIKSLLSSTAGNGDKFFLNDESIQKMIEKYTQLGEEIEKAVEEQKRLTEEQERVKKLQAQSHYRDNLLQNKVKQFAQGTDVGNAIEGFENGGVWGAVFNTLLSALSNVIGGMEGMNLVMNPITELLKELEPTIKSLMLPTFYIAKGLVYVARGIQWLLNVLTFGLIDKLADEWDDLVDESKNNTSALKNSTQAINGVINSLIQLQSEIDKQQKYYKEEKLNINAQNKYRVNDMILTPRGVFSTHPKDTIIATKNPQDLVSNGSVNVVINNTQARDVNVSTRQDNYGKLIIDISRKIASDYANGSNGWDNAVGVRETRKQGRKLS